MRLIDDFALTTALEKRIDEATNEDFAEGLCEALIEVHFAPTIDAVPVVRCKDCKYAMASSILPTVCVCTHGKGLVDPSKESFCSYGERREE